MKVQAPFGFVTGCHAGDKFMVQATLASMRHYCPDVPICLTVDGDFDVSDLEKEYDLIVLRVSELPSEEMRNLVSGSGRAKLPPCGRGLLNFTYGWIRTRLSGATLLRRSAPMSIFRFSGARFPSRQMPPKFHPGCRIFILTRKS